MIRSSVLALVCLFTAGCGYHAAGRVNTLPDDIRTIAVPAFINQTQTYKIEQKLTAAVVQELVTRTRYHIVSQSNGATDATLHGTVISTYTTPLTYDSRTGRAASVLVIVSMKVILNDAHGKVLFQNPSCLFREQYQVTSDLNTFFEEDSPAFERLARDFAQTLVSNILEGF